MHIFPFLEAHFCPDPELYSPSDVSSYVSSSRKPSRIGSDALVLHSRAPVSFPQSTWRRKLTLLINVCLFSRSQLHQAAHCFSPLLYPQHITQCQAHGNAQYINTASLIKLMKEQTLAAERAGTVMLTSLSPVSNTH